MYIVEIIDPEKAELVYNSEVFSRCCESHMKGNNDTHKK